MSEIQQQILELQHQRGLFAQQVRRRDDLLKLSEIPEYKRLIREDFMVTDCARFVEQSVNPAITDPAQRADALAKAQAAGHLKQYLSVIVLQGNHAEREIFAIDEALEELRADDAAGDEDA